MFSQFGLNNVIGMTRPVNIAKVNKVDQEGLGSLHKDGETACHKFQLHLDAVLVWNHLYLGSPRSKLDKAWVVINDNDRICVNIWS